MSVKIDASHTMFIMFHMKLHKCAAHTQEFLTMNLNNKSSYTRYVCIYEDRIQVTYPRRTLGQQGETESFDKNRKINYLHSNYTKNVKFK
jgi:hypothetical protein